MVEELQFFLEVTACGKGFSVIASSSSSLSPLSSSRNDQVYEELLQSMGETFISFFHHFFEWTHAGNQISRCLFQSTSLSVLQIMKKVQDNTSKHGLLVPSTLYQRLQCCSLLVSCITGGKPPPYPDKSLFNPLHPCDAFLRGLVGDSCEISDLLIVEIHKKIAKKSVEYVQIEPTSLTRFITNRRYNNISKPIISGCTPPHYMEALLHTVFHSRGNLKNFLQFSTRASGYDPLGTVFLPFNTAFPVCRWFPGMLKK